MTVMSTSDKYRVAKYRRLPTYAFESQTNSTCMKVDQRRGICELAQQIMTGRRASSLRFSKMSCICVFRVTLVLQLLLSVNTRAATYQIYKGGDYNEEMGIINAIYGEKRDGNARCIFFEERKHNLLKIVSGIRKKCRMLTLTTLSCCTNPLMPDTRAVDIAPTEGLILAKPTRKAYIPDRYGLLHRHVC